MKKWKTLYMDEHEVFAGETEKAILIKIPNTEHYFYYPKSLTEQKNKRVYLENINFVRILYYTANSKVKLFSKKIVKYGTKSYPKYVNTGIEITIEEIKNKYCKHYKLFHFE